MLSNLILLFHDVIKNFNDHCDVLTVIYLQHSTYSENWSDKIIQFYKIINVQNTYNE